MDNLEKASFDKFIYDKNQTGDIIKSSVEDNVCCFITNINNLIVSDYQEDVKSYLLDYIFNRTVIELKYLSVWQIVFISTKSNLFVYEIEREKLLIVHSSLTDIIHTSWNPNETFLVVIDKQNVLYGFSFEVNTSNSQYHFIEISRSNLGTAVPNSVYVGWGSHNTQFKGAKKKEEEKIEEIAQPYSSPIISWRGNGEQFVINFWKGNRRYLKVFDSYLRPLYQSETYPNLLSPTSFKGQGNFIACVAQHNEKNKVVIFEKNCLVKSEFFIPENKGHVKTLMYHPDMHILAIYSEDFESNGFLNIYVNANAHWYLKQQLYYPVSKKLISFHWTTILDKTMCTLNVLTSEAIERILFRIRINRYPEDSLVAVIDGKTVHFTKFSEQIIPPPLSSVSLSFDKPVNRIFHNPYEHLFYFIKCGKEVDTYLYNDGEFSQNAQLHSPEYPSNPSCIYHIEKVVDNIQYHFVLDRKQDLLLNDTIVCNNVLSVYIYDYYLLFTHASCKLYCLRLTSQNLLNPTWNLSKLYSREVEQGAKIVSVTKNSDIVLELPRGNLETITCRVIAIDMIEKLLTQNKWEEAMLKIRHQRLTWNLLIDLNLERFSQHIGEFIKAAKTISILNTIVSEFSKENCLQTMYSQCVERTRTFSESEKTMVFSKILDQIILLNPVLNLISIVTLQTKHFTLRSALKSVCTVFEKGVLDICKKAVFQILLHSHVTNVISEAFTLYNIDFMTFIYTCCSEDPKMFEPELEKLKELGPIELRFKMNLLGKNFKGATKYLIRCLSYDEKFISDFITKYGTQNVAYDSISPNHPNFKLISRLYANYLSHRARHNEAGLILERSRLNLEALEEYKKALNWYQVVSLLETLKIETGTRKELLLALANELVNKKRVDEGVIIYEHYCGDHGKAIEVLTERKMFQKACSLAKKYNCDDVIENLIKPAIIKYRQDLFEKITEMCNKFIQYSARLEKVREKKLNSLKYRHLEGEDTFDNDDLHSEYGSIISSRGSSVGSKGSRSSTLSSRNRRKQEKKKIDLREGGVYEDIALIRQLYLLIIDIFECGPDLKEVCLALTDNESFNYSKKLHEIFIDTQETVRSHIPRIWSDTFLNAADSPEPEILSVIHNRVELDAEFRKPPPSDKMMDNWKLLIFSKH